MKTPGRFFKVEQNLYFCESNNDFCSSLASFVGHWYCDAKQKINSMARPQPKTKPLFKSNDTGYIYSIAYRVKVDYGNPAGIPTPEPFYLITLSFHGEHPEYENTIVTTQADFERNFTPYNPIKTDTPTKSQPK